jgi:dihydrofolate reductase
LKNFPKEEELWVVGGATIYKFSLPYADSLYITHVDGEYEGDAYFPKFDLENEFKLISSRISNNLNFAVYERV